MCNLHTAGDLQLARRMHVVGVPLDLGEFEDSLIIRQDRESVVHSIASSYISSHHIGLVIITYIKVVGNSPVPLRLCGFDLRLPWQECPATLLPDPADPLAPAIYKFPGNNGSRFDHSQIIWQSGKTLRRGNSHEGFLLAFEHDPLPIDFKHGVGVPVVLNIFDQFDEIHTQELTLTADRSVEWLPKPKLSPRRRNLFDKRDSRICESRCASRPAPRESKTVECAVSCK